MFEKNLHFYLKFLFISAIFILIGAGFIGYFYEIDACILCAIQRDIWLLIFLWSGFSFLKLVHKKIHMLMLIALLLICASFLTSFYHIGIEYGFWILPESLCSIKNIDYDALLNPDLNALSIPSCKQPFELIKGISLALINTILSGCLLLFGIITYIKNRES